MPLYGSTRINFSILELKKASSGRFRKERDTETCRNRKAFTPEEASFVPRGRIRVEAANGNRRRPLAAWGISAIQWEWENGERSRERDRPHDWGDSFRDALGVAAAAVAATTMGGRNGVGATRGRSRDDPGCVYLYESQGSAQPVGRVLGVC